MNFFRPPWTRVPDDEYIAKLRSLIAWWDRFRLLAVLLHVGMLAIGIWSFSKGISLLLGFQPPGKAPIVVAGLVTGISMGLIIGWICSGLIHGLFIALGGFRAERLLLKLLDEQDPALCESEIYAEHDTDL